MQEFCGIQEGTRENAPTMIRVIRVCRKCGAKILSDAPEGLCGRCVLKAALGDFADAPVAGGDDPGHMEHASRDEPNVAANVSKIRGAAELLGELGDYELLEAIGRDRKSTRLNSSH